MLKTLEPNSCDLITLFGGVNDWQMPFLEIGTFDDMETDTFYSRIRKTVEYVITNFPDATFALITPLPASFSYGNNAEESGGRSLKTISDMIIEVGNHYSVPVLDMFRNSGMYPWHEEHNHKYFKREDRETPDGLHPNKLGHQVMAHKIGSFINSL